MAGNKKPGGNPALQTTCYEVTEMSLNTNMKISNTVTMSSREIADLVGSRHDSVKRTIERLSGSSIITQPPMVDESYRDGSGRTVTMRVFLVGKRDSYIVVAQLCPEFTARLVDRWQELEDQQFAIPSTLPDALRLAADLAEERTQLRLVIADQAPKVHALELLTDASGSMCMTDAAKHLGVQRKRLLDYLKENRWIYRRTGSAHWVAYQPRLMSGLLDHKVSVIGTDDDGCQRLASRVRVTPKGLALLAQKVGGLL